MEHHSKLQIYKGMIQYFLESTNYNLKNIADLSQSTIKNIQSIYCDDLMPAHFISELQLIKLFQIILEINISENNCRRHCSQQSGCHQCDVLTV